MMGRKQDQQCIAIIDMESIVPDAHLLKKIRRMVDFAFVYDAVAPYYGSKGRPSIDPVCQIKMMLVGYLYGIRSERKLEEEVSLNIAYRWFCGFSLNDRIPDHSLFSQNRRRRFGDSAIFREIFNQIVMRCIGMGIVTGEAVVSDGSFLPANVSDTSKVEVEEAVTRSTVSYLDTLDEELSALPGHKSPQPEETKKTALKSTTDPDCGYIHQERKKGLGYLTQMTVDTDHGIITGVDCYPANRRESDIILIHLQQQMEDTRLTINRLALDAGYDVGAVHRGCEHLGIVDYCCPRISHNNPMKKGFTYDAGRDCFLCRMGKTLTFYRIIYKKKDQCYYRLYRISRKECKDCEHLASCSVDRGAVRINASPFYPAYYANRKRTETEMYQWMKRLRSIWSEGTFAALKANHNLSRIRKRGIHRATEECLLAAIALNLKRLVSVCNIHCVGKLRYLCFAGTGHFFLFCSPFGFCQQFPYFIVP